ncbi:MAG: HipA domain-containing protein [Saccharofermentanales bacterium]
MTDYSKYPVSNRYYTGAEMKVGIMIKGKPYFVKFRKNSPEGLRFNHISEYLGSHIFSFLGINAQETDLGLYDSKEIVLIRDFLEDDETFVPFNGVGDSTLDEDIEKFQYDYNDIIKMLNNNIKLTNVKETIDCFWDMYIIDALLGNFDRHGSNWGFIKKDDEYRIAPVFDNGSCLFPLLNTDEKIDKIILSEDEMNKRIYTFPTSQIKLNGNKSSYFEVINSLAFLECNKALIRIIERFEMSRIERLIENTGLISEKRRDFYKMVIKQRFDKILMASYQKLE